MRVTLPLVVLGYTNQVAQKTNARLYAWFLVVLLYNCFVCLTKKVLFQIFLMWTFINIKTIRLAIFNLSLGKYSHQPFAFVAAVTDSYSV